MSRVGFVLFLILVGCFMFVTTASALDEKMAAEFTYLSSQTRLAMDLAPAELETLLVRCEQLQKETAGLKGSEKKVTEKKLRRLCGLFSYVLQSKQAAAEVEPGQ